MINNLLSWSYLGLKVQNLHLLSLKQRSAQPAMFPTLMPFVVYRLCPEYFVFSSIEQSAWNIVHKVSLFQQTHERIRY